MFAIVDERNQVVHLNGKYLVDPQREELVKMMEGFLHTKVKGWRIVELVIKENGR